MMGRGRIGGTREREEIKGKGEMGGRIEKRKEGVKCRNSMEAKSMEKVEEERKQRKARDGSRRKNEKEEGKCDPACTEAEQRVPPNSITDSRIREKFWEANIRISWK